MAEAGDSNQGGENLSKRVEQIQRSIRALKALDMSRLRGTQPLGLPSEGATTGDPTQSTVAETENRQPGNVSINFLFREHSITDPSQLPAIRRDLRALFKPGVRNIYVAESADIDPRREREIQAGYEHHGSYRKPYFEILYGLRQKGQVLKEGAEQRAFTLADEDLHGGPIPLTNLGKAQRAYQWLEASTLDELIGEGYDIRYVEEPGVKESIRPDITNSTTIEGYKKTMLAFRDTILQRNTAVTQQISELADQAEREGTDTNIAAVFGTLHHPIAEGLPPHLQGATTMQVEAVSIPPSPELRLFGHLLDGKDPTPAEWQDAFAAFVMGQVAKKLIEEATRREKK